MLVGSLFTREVVASSRRTRHYYMRCGYPVALFVLFWTCWQEMIGGQRIVSVGDLARFGSLLFQILAFVQLGAVLFLSPLSVAGSVAQEKDRRTLVLLLMTELRNHELVLGKLLSGLLPVGTILLAAFPLFALCLLMGGVSAGQLVSVFLITGAAALGMGSVGVTIAFWREKTFQTLALVVLSVVLFLLGSELLSITEIQGSFQGVAERISPRAAILAVFEQDPSDFNQWSWKTLGHPCVGFCLWMLVLSGLLNLVSMAGIRRWNPSSESRAFDKNTEARDEDRKYVLARTAHGESDFPESITALGDPAQATVSRLLESRDVRKYTKRLPSRTVWVNPILWREMRTRAYGSRTYFITAAYVLLFLTLCFYLSVAEEIGSRSRLLPVPALALVVVTVVSLLLINAQATTSVSSERDSRSLELLLVTDVTPPEFVYGKISGAFFNCKWILLSPILMVAGFWWLNRISLENCGYLVIGLLILYVFAAVLGIHSGLTFSNSRVAIANSLGTVFFLFVGIFVCINLVIAAGSSFERGFFSFLIFILGGGIGLFASMGAKNPSSAIFLAAMSSPFFTFYAIVSFHEQYTLGVFLVMGATYAWASTAMLIPAIHKFDVALGRTSMDRSDTS